MKRIKSFDNSHPLLYLIATPIGNLGEFSSRALDTIKDMDFLACEDTRNTKDLLSKFGINKKLVSLREHNEAEMSNYVVKEILDGKKVAYVSDAGYPAISDPGNILVKIAHDNDVAISVISGSSAFINALVSSNLDTNHFYFHGFLPAKEGETKRELEQLKNKEETLIFYESPHRIKDTIQYMLDVLGDRNMVLERELTKINEEKIYGKTSEFLSLDFSTIKGEIVLVVEGNKSKEVLSVDEIKKYVVYFMEKGMTKKDAIESVSVIFKIKKNYIKDLFN